MILLYIIKLIPVQCRIQILCKGTAHHVQIMETPKMKSRHCQQKFMASECRSQILKILDLPLVSMYINV